MLDGNEEVKVWSVRLLNKEKGPSIGGVKFNIPPAPPSIRLPRWKRRVGVEEEEGDVKMDGGHEDDGDYEAESSAAKRVVKGRERARVKERSGGRRKSGLHLHRLPLSRQRRRPPSERRVG